MRQNYVPSVINTDRNPSYGDAIRNLKRSQMLSATVDHRQVKYLNNQIEADHGAIKRRIHSMLGFKSLKTAYATLKGIEVMHMIRKRQCILLKRMSLPRCSSLTSFSVSAATASYLQQPAT